MSDDLEMFMCTPTESDLNLINPSADYDDIYFVMAEDTPLTELEKTRLLPRIDWRLKCGRKKYALVHNYLRGNLGTVQGWHTVREWSQAFRRCQPLNVEDTRVVIAAPGDNLEQIYTIQLFWDWALVPFTANAKLRAQRSCVEKWAYTFEGQKYTLVTIKEGDKDIPVERVQNSKVLVEWTRMYVAGASINKYDWRVVIAGPGLPEEKDFNIFDFWEWMNTIHNNTTKTV